MATKLSELISELTLAEGGKSSVSVGNVREILRRLKVLVGKNLEHAITLDKYLAPSISKGFFYKPKAKPRKK